MKNLCKINPSKNELDDLSDDKEITFVPMRAVSGITRRIESPEIRLLGNVKKGYTYFREGDIIFAKITPCMENGKSAIARDLINKIGFGSTEFHVIRTLKQVIPEWIHCFLRQASFRIDASRNMTGTAGQQRVPKAFLEETEIPLPTIEEQGKIVTHLDRLEKKIFAIREIHDTEKEIEELISSIQRRVIKQ